MTRFGLRLALPVVLLAAVVKPARANEPAPAPSAPIAPLDAAAPPARVWYGWQVLAADASVAALTAGCFATIDQNICGLPLVAFFGTGPLVHTLHNGWKRGAASLGIRAASLSIGVAIGAAFADCPEKSGVADFCGFDSAGMGGLIGLTVGLVIDSFWAFDDGGPHEPLARPQTAAWSVTPTIKVSDNSAGFGFAGRF